MDMVEFGGLFRKTRKRKGFSSGESFGLKIGVSQQAVNGWETGKAFPSDEHWPKILEELGLNCEALKDEIALAQRVKQVAKNNSAVYQAVGNQIFGGSGGGLEGVPPDKLELIQLIIDCAPQIWVQESIETLRKIREMVSR